jgi:hypothetical protein
LRQSGIFRRSRGVEILRPNHVWSTDITYIPMRSGFLYLVAVMDWFSRFVLSWELSNTMETSFCLAALDSALRFGQPEIWNSDQGRAVHLRRISGSAPEAWHLDQHGWPWPSLRQCFHRAAVALAQVRTDLPRRLRHRPRSLPGVGKLFPLLQPSAPASGIGVSDTGRPIPAQIQKEEVTFLMRALPSNSRDLTLLLPEWMLFALLQWHIAVHSKCLRGGQGSAGTRPEHRCKSGMDGGFTAAILFSPPLHLRTADFLSKRWGPPHFF